MNFDKGSFGGGLGAILGGLFGHPGAGYDDAMQQTQQYGQQAAAPQQDYLNAGHQALGNYQGWLQGQQDPSAFINNQIGRYQESPYAQYLQKQSMRAGNNMASANGLMGSTPMMQQMQQNAHDIGSQDMNQWLSHVLGINTQYGQGLGTLMQGGQASANTLTNLYNNMGQRMREDAYNKGQTKDNNLLNTLGGLGGLLSSFL